jgi:hypothetical protein
VAYFTVQALTASSRWRTLIPTTKRHSLILRVHFARTFRFRVRGFEASGTYSAWAYGSVRLRR